MTASFPIFHLLPISGQTRESQFCSPIQLHRTPCFQSASTGVAAPRTPEALPGFLSLPALLPGSAVAAKCEWRRLIPFL